MQKKLKKLALHKETLRNLEESALRNAAGGERTHTNCSNTCPVGTSVEPSGCVATHCVNTCDAACA